MKKITFILIAMIAMFSCSKNLTPSSKKTNAAIEPVVSAPITTTGTPKVKARPLLSDTMQNKNATTKTVGEVVENPRETPQVQSGKITYKTKCAKCHDAKDPQSYDAAKWVKIVDWMAPRAKLDAAEKANVLAFVTLYAKG
jgi:cytochrome c5